MSVFNMTTDNHWQHYFTKVVAHRRRRTPQCLSSMCGVEVLFAAWVFLSSWGCCTSNATQGYELPGEACLMGGNVWGFCQEVRSCLNDGGVVASHGEVHLCLPQPSEIIVCCRKPHLVAKELCNAWKGYWRNEHGNCVYEKPLIVGGTDAEVGEFPYVTQIGSSTANLPVRFFCGGTLLSPYHVLSAAHCFPVAASRGDTKYWVKLGEHDRNYDSTQEFIPVKRGHLPRSLYRWGDLQNDPLISSQTSSQHPGDLVTPVEQIIEVEEMIPYPYYLYRQYEYHDIIVLKLKHPARFSRRVLPACLPTNPKEDYRRHRLTVVGWGLTDSLLEESITPQKVDIPVVSSLSCMNIIEKNRPQIFRSNTLPLGITEDMICAGEVGRDSCKGDSGGPLTAISKEGGIPCEHSVVGVVSFGVGANYRPCGIMGVYMRVSYYLDWITELIAPNVTATSTSL